MARQYDIFFLVYTTISLSLPLSLPAHLPFPDIWLATEEIDLEEDQFLHVERIQPVGESCSYSLHNRDRCGEQVKTNFKQFQTVLKSDTTEKRYIIFSISGSVLPSRRSSASQPLCKTWIQIQR